MSKPVFIGREDEIGQLNTLLGKRTASIAVLRGRRRVGKSRLIETFGEKMTFYRFAGLAPDQAITAQDQRNEFSLRLSVQTQLPELQTNDWSKLFLLLAEKVKQGRIVLLFDEITWMAQDDPSFLSKLKNAWEFYFSKNSQLIFVICGSISAWIEKHILDSTGFLGRISLEIVLKEMPLPDCNKLLDSLGFQRSVKEKLAYLSLTGCIPWYIEQINPNLSAEENIKNLCFIPNAIMLKEFKRVFHDLFGKRGHIYQKIVSALAKSTLSYSEIANAIGYSTGQALTDYLNELVSARYITRFTTWDLKNKKEGGILMYRLSDNYLRFYFRYIQPKLSSIQSGRYTSIEVSQLSGWRSMCGLQFENLILNNCDLIWRELNLSPADIVMEGPYIQRKTNKAEGCQIDYLIQTKLNTLFAIEIKFHSTPLTTSVINSMRNKLKKLKIPRNFTVVPVLIHAGEVSDPVQHAEYFFKVIDIHDLI